MPAPPVPGATRGIMRALFPKIPGPIGAALVLWDLGQMSNPKSDPDRIGWKANPSWIFRSYGTAQGLVVGTDGITMPEVPVTTDNTQALTWANSGLSYMVIARTYYDPLNYGTGAQPAYPAPLPGQSLSAREPNTTMGLWLFDFQQVPNNPRYLHVATFLQKYIGGRPQVEHIPGTVKPAYFSCPHSTLGYSYADAPLSIPVFAPAFSPVPRPIGRPAPRPEPWSPEWPDVGPRPQPRPQPRPRPRPRPDANARPMSRPFAPGAVVVTPNVGPRPVAPKGPQPPGPRTKERKGGLPPWAAAVWRGVGPITEAGDFIDSFYEALPRRTKIAEYNKRGRQPNPLEKLDIIYRNIGSLDLGKALGNVVANEVEDRAIGKFGKALGQASANSGRPIGFGAGPAL